MRKAILLAAILSGALSAACGGRKVTQNVPVLVDPEAVSRNNSKEDRVQVYEPDRELYERARKEMNRGRFDIARLTFQNLINTYLDSEYLPKAKYALGEASYREGGREKLEQAAAEFEDYITLFPTTDLADDAQLMIALTHYRQMLAPDRDATQARFALIELDRMIKEYPDSPLLDEAKFRRQVVQDRLADAAYRIGSLYLAQGKYQAAINRFEEIVKTYPDFSRTDEVLFALGETMRRGGAVNAIRTKTGLVAAEGGGCPCVVLYQQVVRDFPRSKRAPDAKQHLIEMKAEVPPPGPLSVPPAKLEERGIFGRLLASVFGKGPIMSDTTGAETIVDKKKTTGDAPFSLNPKVERP